MLDIYFCHHDSWDKLCLDHQKAILDLVKATVNQKPGEIGKVCNIKRTKSYMNEADKDNFIAFLAH